MTVQRYVGNIVTAYLSATQPAGAPAPLAVWQLDGTASSLLDRTANGHDLTADVGTPSYATVEGLVGVNFDSNKRLVAPNLEAFRIAKDNVGGGDASLTIEAIVRLDSGLGVVSCDSVGESPASNFLYRMGSHSSGTWASFCEYGNGSNVSMSFPGFNNVTGKLAYVAFTVNSTGANRQFFQSILPTSLTDSVVLEKATKTSTAAQKGTSGNAQRMRIGGDGNGNYIRGVVCSVRITAGVYTDDQIQASLDSILEQVEVVESDTANAAAVEELFNFPELGVLRGSSASSVEDTPEDQASFLGLQPTYTDVTLDSSFVAHLSQKEVLGAFFYNTSGEDWSDPVTSGMTGYARDGNRYTAGVLDGGPTQAPWAAEAFSTIRGARDDFPEKALIVWTAGSVTIFDLDSYPTDLGMWMRFTVTSTTLLRTSIQDIKMLNGVMTVATVASNGALIIVDFKGDTSANTGHWIAGNAHYLWNGTLAQRNNGSSLWTASGVSPSLRINSEYNYSLASYKDPSQNKAWYAVAGEDDTHVVEVLDGVPQVSYYPARGPIWPVNVGDIRKAHFDDRGWLWVSEQNKLTRHVFAYQGGAMISEERFNIAQTGVNDAHRFVELPEDIIGIASARNNIYCATASGIYQVSRGSLARHLAYTIEGGGGGGKDNAPPAGEILVGDSRTINDLVSISFVNSSYLAVSSPRGTTLIRLFDDYVVKSFEYPDLAEFGAHFNVLSWN